MGRRAKSSAAVIDAQSNRASPQTGECGYDIRVEVVHPSGNRSTGTLHDAQQPLWQEPIQGFVVLPKRWAVERTHAWNERRRRKVMHHDRKTSISAGWVWLAKAHIRLSRLALIS